MGQVALIVTVGSFPWAKCSKLLGAEYALQISGIVLSHPKEQRV